MKKVFLICLTFGILCGICGNAAAFDYGGQDISGTLSASAALTYDAPESIKELEFDSFMRKYCENKQEGMHLANLGLIEEMLPLFYGTEYESSLYDTRTEAVFLCRQQKKAPLALDECIFEVRGNAGFVIAGLTNTDYRNVVSLKVEFDVLDVNGEPTGDRRNFYYAVGADIAPGESERFIWQVNNMSEPSEIGNFKVLEIVFADSSKWYSRYEY